MVRNEDEEQDEELKIVRCSEDGDCDWDCDCDGDCMSLVNV